MHRFELVIVGGGLASAQAIKSYREAGGAGTIALVSRDKVLPYHRPPLSKRFLRGETDETPLVEEEAFYVRHGVEVLLETTVSAVDPDERAVELTGGERLAFEKLLIASGAYPRMLAVPGAELDGVFTLRTLDDSKRIREAAASARRAAVVGAGFIGMEVAASLRQLGVDVSLVHLGRWVFDQLGVEQLSDELAELYRRHGVELVLGDQVASLDGHGRLEAVTTANGKRVEADLAVVGIGVEPAVSFLDGSGLEVTNGVVVNERFETSVPGIYAVGDVARFYDPLFERHRRIEHWSNANYQGTEVGRVLAGADGGYDRVSAFFSEVFGLTIKVFGDPRRDAEDVVHGSLADGDLYALYGVDGDVVGALSVGQADEVEELLQRLVAEHAPVATAQIAAG